MSQFAQPTLLLLALLNPFLLILYVIDLVRDLKSGEFRAVMARAGLIAAVVFVVFAIAGEVVFWLIQADFASFRIFGGVVLLIIGVKYMLNGPSAMAALRGGSSKHLAGAVAMPILIGPGTLSACVIIGKSHTPLAAAGIIALSVVASLSMLVALKWVHDIANSRHAELVKRYIESTGRVTAFYIGTVAVEMVMNGMVEWSKKF